MTTLKRLHNEFTELKNKLFGKDKFIVLDRQANQGKDVERYNLLFQFFNPQFRTKGTFNDLMNQLMEEK